MKDYLILVSLTWFLSQTIKYVIKKINKNNIVKDLKSTYLYLSGSPSTHTAVLVSVLLLTVKKVGIDNEIFVVLLLFSVFWIYEIILQRKRVRALVHIIRIKEKEKICLLEDCNGHDLIDIISGILVGLSMYTLFNYLNYV